MTIRLFMAQPATVFAAQVNMPSGIAYPIRRVTFNNVTTGNYSSVKDGMTVLFGSTPGDDDYGRVRALSANASNEIIFGYSSRGTKDGEVEVVDDAYITVLNDYRVWSKIPIIDSNGVVYKDGAVGAGVYNINTVPVANTGPGTCGTVNSGTNLLTVTFDGSTSFTTAPGASISTYTWSITGSGTSNITGGQSTNTMTATFTPGFYWVTLTIADSNGSTHAAHCPVFARDAASDVSIQSFTISSHRITTQGQEITLDIKQSVAETSYPDGTLVMLWDGEPSSATDRSHMMFIGWHHDDPASIESRETGIVKDTSLNCLDVAGKLKHLPGFPQEVENVASPSNWMEMTDPNMDRYLHYLIHWHSTGIEVADFTWSGTTTTFPFVVLGSDGESIFDQVNRRANSLVPDYHLTCNTLGQLYINVDPMLQDTGDRTATVQAALTESDWTSIRYAYTRSPTVHWHRGSAVLASGTTITPLFCIAPGDSPGQGEMAQDHGEQLAVSQTTLNACEGHRYARNNKTNGYYTIVLTAGDDKDIEPADLTWVTLAVSSANAAWRGQALATIRGLVHEISISYSFGRTGVVKTVELTWERETSGYPATTVTPVVGDLSILPGDNFWPYGYWNTNPTTSGSTGFQAQLYIAAGSRADASNDGGQTWNTWTPGAGTVVSTPEIGAENYGYFGLSNGKLYQTSDYLATAPTEIKDFGSQINVIWVHEVLQERLTVGLANGEIWRTNDALQGVSATWSLLKTYGSAVLYIIESALSAGQYRVATGEDIRLTTDDFATDSQLLTWSGGTARWGALSFAGNFACATHADAVKNENGSIITGAGSDVRALTHHINESVLFASSLSGSDALVYKSIADASFAQIGTISASGQPNHMIRDGATPSVLYLAANNGVYATTDGGLTWHTIRDYSTGSLNGYQVGYGSPAWDAVTPVTILTASGSDLCLSLWNGSSNDAEPAGWTTVEYDDASWNAPVSASGGYTAPTGATRVWFVNRGVAAQTGEACLFRFSFTLTQGAVTIATMDSTIDDKLDAAYMNGVQFVTGPLDGNDAGDPILYNIPTGLFLPGQENVLALRAADAGAGWVFIALRIEIS